MKFLNILSILVLLGIVVLLNVESWREVSICILIGIYGALQFSVGHETENEQENEDPDEKDI